jgi:hypothetical protein
MKCIFTESTEKRMILIQAQLNSQNKEARTANRVTQGNFTPTSSRNRA